MSIEPTPPDDKSTKVFIKGKPVECLFEFNIAFGFSIMPPLLSLPPLIEEFNKARLRGLSDDLTEHFGDTDPRLG